MISFHEVFDRIIGYEGGYVNDPNDPGGETKWGISKRSYPDLDIKSLTRDEAKEIYRRDFWDKIPGIDDEGEIAFQVFDFAVNSGISTAIRYLQRALGVADDGHFGIVSEQALSASNESDVIMRLSAERLDYMTKLKNWDINSKGWTRRIAQSLRYGASDTV